MLALSSHWGGIILGVALWGLHMGMTQGLLAAMIAKTAPADLRGTAYGIFSMVSGVGLLIASVGAGAIWEAAGAEYTFYAGAVICLLRWFTCVKRRTRCNKKTSPKRLVLKVLVGTRGFEPPTPDTP